MWQYIKPLGKLRLYQLEISVRNSFKPFITKNVITYLIFTISGPSVKMRQLVFEIEQF